MSHTNGSLDGFAVAFASASGAQRSGRAGIQAPENTPADGNTPRNNTPDSAVDELSWAYGYVIPKRYRGDPNVKEEDEFVEIVLQDGNKVLIQGREAKEARLKVGIWYADMPVQVWYFGGSSRVKEVTKWNGTIE